MNRNAYKLLAMILPLAACTGDLDNVPSGPFEIEAPEPPRPTPVPSDSGPVVSEDPTPEDAGAPPASWPLPSGATLLMDSNFAAIANEVNRTDQGLQRNAGPFHLHRSVPDGLRVVDVSGTSLLKATIADGRRWGGSRYDRAELMANQSNVVADQDVTYVYEWRGYVDTNLPGAIDELLIAFQIHGKDNDSPPVAMALRDTQLYWRDRHNPQGKQWYPIMQVKDWVNKPITVRLTLKLHDSDGYVKCEVDGRTIQERRGGRTRNTSGAGSYPKGAGIYDFNNNLVSPTSSAGRSYALYSEYFRIYRL
jgi:hypothetical protein